jgi:hypothetical protein
MFSQTRCATFPGRPETCGHPARRAGRPAAAPVRILVRLTALFILAASAVASPASAQEHWLLQGLVDAEYWNTDDGSRLLALDDGERSGVGRLRLWAAGDFAESLQGFVRGAVSGGDACGQEPCETDTDLEQAWLRWTVPGRARLMIEAGRIVTPVGDFPRRYLSTDNPLIGVPSDYTVAYPDGLAFAAWAGPVDFKVAVVDRPLYADWYAPEPGDAFRPMLGAGWTPMVGLRFAGFATSGPYLGPDSEAALVTGDGWQDYDQSVYGAELQFSRGHFELHGQFARSAYEVPGFAERAYGKTYWLEPRYTFTPRLFAAARIGQNDYPYIAPIYGTTWIASSARVADIEVGVGYRVLPDLLVKASYRRDKWWVPEGLESMLPGGHAFALAASWKFDLGQAVSRPD